MKQKMKFSREPNMDGLTHAQREHVLRVFPETQASMADFLRQGVEVFIYTQDEVPDVPPVAIAVLQSQGYWIECCESESAAHALATKLGLVVVSVAGRTRATPTADSGTNSRVSGPHG